MRRLPEGILLFFLSFFIGIIFFFTVPVGQLFFGEKIQLVKSFEENSCDYPRQVPAAKKYLIITRDAYQQIIYPEFQGV
ncbi:MAG: hypothetical protein WCI64_09435 [Chlorobium sp.]